MEVCRPHRGRPQGRPPRARAGDGQLVLREIAQTPDEDLRRPSRTSRAGASSTPTTCGSTCAALRRGAGRRDGVLGLPMIVNRKTRRPRRRLDARGLPARDGDGRGDRGLRGRPRAARAARALRAGQDDQRPARAALGRLRADRRRRTSCSRPSATAGAALRRPRLRPLQAARATSTPASPPARPRSSSASASSSRATSRSAAASSRAATSWSADGGGRLRDRGRHGPRGLTTGRGGSRPSWPETPRRSAARSRAAGRACAGGPRRRRPGRRERSVGLGAGGRAGREEKGMSGGAGLGYVRGCVRPLPKNRLRPNPKPTAPISGTIAIGTKTIARTTAAVLAPGASLFAGPKAATKVATASEMKSRLHSTIPIPSVRRNRPCPAPRRSRRRSSSAKIAPVRPRILAPVP